MTRINLLLLLGVVFSALHLVNIQYESRRLFAELDQAQAEGRRLAIEQERLNVEKRVHATSARVERIAREKLQMRQTLPAITTYVAYAETPAPVAVAGAGVGAAALQNTAALAVSGGQP
ncbi:MAG: cell division protein FtsL [Rhodoferax sp.]|nr:cell division protein FtsL [Rhodoferax sp.]